MPIHGKQVAVFWRSVTSEVEEAANQGENGQRVQGRGVHRCFRLSATFCVHVAMKVQHLLRLRLSVMSSLILSWGFL